MNGNIFWNADQNRLRAFWRLLLQGIVFILITLLGSLVVGIIVGVVIAAGGADLTDPATFAMISGHPLTRAGSAVTSLIAMFVSYWIAARWLDRRAFADFGFHLNRSWWIDLGFGLFLGAVLMLLIFLVELALGWGTVTGSMQSFQPEFSFWGGILGAVVTFLCVGIYEEMLSRGYHLRNLAEGFNFKGVNPRTALLIAYLLSSSVFGFLHFFNQNATWVSTFNLIIAGLFLGLGYVLTGELAIPIGLHITWNFFQGNVFGFPVSGGQAGATFIAIQQGGPELWTGGAFGPEAGLIGLLAIALGSLLTVLWVRYRYGAARLQDRLAVYRSPRQPETAAAQPVASIQDGG